MLTRNIVFVAGAIAAASAQGVRAEHSVYGDVTTVGLAGPSAQSVSFRVGGRLSSNPGFAVASFGLGGYRLALDVLYGVNNWTITGAYLTFQQSVATPPWAPGGVSVYWANHVVSSAGLVFDGAHVGGNSQVSPQGVPHDPAALATFAYPTDPLSAYAYVPLAPSSSLLGSLNSFGELTLVFEAADSDVLASYNGVELYYTAERPVVPAPGSVGLTIALSGLMMRRRVRHA
ncbi:MAG TPA: hypothetical protein VF777_09415 [Phycisphaerales bacterium]